MSVINAWFCLLVGLALLQTAAGIGCLYADVYERKWRDSDEPQDIYSIKLIQEREGLKIDFLQSTTNEFVVKVHYNAGGFLPAVARTSGSLVEININGLLYLLPDSSSHLSAEVNLLLAGLAQAVAFQDRRCATLVGAAYFFSKIMGVNGQAQTCPVIKVQIYTPPGRCKVDGYDTSLEGYWLVDCPLPPTPPTQFPTRAPTYYPTTSAPSPQPTTATPTLFVPTEFPTRSPSLNPTVSPTRFPTRSPTTPEPTVSPTRNPSVSPTFQPTLSCRSYAQIPGNDCADRPDCYEAALDPSIFAEILSSPDIDPQTKLLLQLFLSSPNCYATSEVPGLCLSLDSASCTNAVNDGYCSAVSVFQYESTKWLNGYDRPASNCFPITSVGVCEAETTLVACNATFEPFLELDRQCLWLDYGGGNTACRSPANFSTTECAGLTQTSCESTEPVCVWDGICRENCVYQVTENSCETQEYCQWLTRTNNQGFCSFILRFPAEECVGLNQASCEVALTQKVNTEDSENITTNACVYNTTLSACRAVGIAGLAGTSCHPAHSLVEVEHEGLQHIEDVKVGQRILSKHGFEPIIAMIHAEKDTLPLYYHIQTESFAIDVAKGHLIVVNGQLKDPRDVKPGDVLETMKGAQEVYEISLRRAKGAYHLYTASGFYFVDGVLSSDKHGFDEWNLGKDALFDLWKLFVQFRYAIGLPIVNDNKIIWVGDAMRSIDALPAYLKFPIGIVFGSLAFVYGNIVTLDAPIALSLCFILYYTKSSKA